MNWQQRINRARKKGWFTRVDFERVGGWSTCAVGEQGIPAADILHRRYTLVAEYGLDFADAVRADDVSEAQRIYDAIVEEAGKVTR